MRPNRRKRILLFLSILFGFYVSTLLVLSRSSEPRFKVIPLMVDGDSAVSLVSTQRAQRAARAVLTSEGHAPRISNVRNVSNTPYSTPRTSSAKVAAESSISQQTSSQPALAETTMQVNTSLLENFPVHMLQDYVDRQNRKQTIYNEARFPISPEDRKEQVVVIVQVHSRYQFLRLTLASLEKARHSQSILLIISADFVSSELVGVVEGVRFCQVILILSPHSIQLHPSSFPGTDPKDCPARIKRPEAVERGCLNAQHPDMYGHYREAPFSAIKLHWWWKAAFVFNDIRALAAHQGWVLMLEEDHIVSEDFIHVVNLLDSLIKRENRDVDIINIGRQRPTQYLGTGKQYSEEEFFSVYNNMGFAFRRSMWEVLRNCSKEFCEYDDYNWDWTLQMSPHLCGRRHWKTLAMNQPRVYHIGTTCGIHQKTQRCNADEEFNKVNGIFRSQSGQLFPDSLEAIPSRRPRTITPKKPNGGWGDVRDHELCKSIVA